MHSLPFAPWTRLRHAHLPPPQTSRQPESIRRCWSSPTAVHTSMGMPAACGEGGEVS